MLLEIENLDISKVHIKASIKFEEKGEKSSVTRALHEEEKLHQESWVQSHFEFLNKIRMTEVEKTVLRNNSYLPIIYFVCFKNSLLSDLIYLCSVNFRSHNAM